MEEKRVDVNAAVGMGEVILGACHPDCITTIKHWITIIRARFEEVSAAGLVPGWCWLQGWPRGWWLLLQVPPRWTVAPCFQQVLTWAKQHQQRLESALSELVANAELLEELLAWIQWAETTLIQRDQDPMPQNIDQVKALISEHQVSPELSSGEGQREGCSPGSPGAGGTDFSWKSLLKQRGTQLEQKPAQG